MVVTVWTGREARALRIALRMTIEVFAEHLGVGVRTVAKWEARGSKIVPVPTMQEALDTALERAAPAQQSRFEILHAASQAADEYERRSLTFPPRGPATPAELQERVAQSLARPASIGERLLEGLGDHTAALAGAFHALPPESLIGPAAEHLEVIVRLTRCSMGETHRRRLNELGADVATLLGWLCLLLDRDAQAHAHLALAQGLGHESENVTLEAAVTGSMARACSPALTWRGGDPGHALELVERADALASRAPPPMHSWLCERRAIESACAGDPGASDRALDQARETLRSDPGDVGLEGFLGHVLRSQDQWYLTTVEGLCHILLGRGEPAEAALTAALDQAGPTRTRLPIMLVADLAAAYVLRDEPEAATQALAECHRQATERGFAVGLQRARNVRARFPASWRGLHCVADLDERMSLSH